MKNINEAVKFPEGSKVVIMAKPFVNAAAVVEAEDLERSVPYSQSAWRNVKIISGPKTGKRIGVKVTKLVPLHINESKLTFQKFAEDYQPGETFVKVNGQLGAVRGHSDDGQLVHVLFMDGKSGWYNADKIQRIHNTQPSDESLFGRYGAMDESAVNETSRSHYGFSINDRVDVKNNDNFFDGRGLGTVVGFTNAGWPDILLDDHKDFGPLAYLPSRVRKLQQPEDEYGFEKGNNAETTIEPWAGEDDPRNPYNDNVQTEDSDDEHDFTNDPDFQATKAEWLRRKALKDADDYEGEFVYDGNGRYVGPENGTHDAGGHADGERLAAKADYMRYFYDEGVQNESALEMFSDWITVVGNILAHKYGKELDQRANMERLLNFHKHGWSPPQVAQIIADQRPDNFIACAGVEQNEKPIVESEQLEKWFNSVKALFDNGVPSHGLKGLVEQGIIDKTELRKSYKMGLSPQQAFRHLIADLHSVDNESKTVTESHPIKFGRTYVKIKGPLIRGDEDRIGELGHIVGGSDKHDAVRVMFLDGDIGWYEQENLVPVRITARDQEARLDNLRLHGFKNENKTVDFNTVTESFLIGVENSQPGYWYTFGKQGPVFEYRANSKHKVIALPPMNLSGKLMEQKEVSGKWFVRLENKVPKEWLHKYGLIEAPINEEMDWMGLEAQKLISKHNIDLNLFKQWFYNLKEPNQHDQNHYTAVYLQGVLSHIKSFNHFAHAIMSEDLYEGTLEDLLRLYLNDKKNVVYEFAALDDRAGEICPHCKTPWNGSSRIRATDAEGNFDIFPMCQKCKKKISDVALTLESGTPTVWVVTVPSAVHMGVCYLGRGPTKQAAIEDAYGPRASWGNNTRRSMRNADIYETTPEEADKLEHGEYE